jgi:hypothetical protein
MENISLRRQFSVFKIKNCASTLELSFNNKPAFARFKEKEGILREISPL